VDASATGAALLALLATNIWSPDDYRVFQAQLPAEVLQPTGASKYDNQLRRFRRLISALTEDLADIYLDR
jgi:sugar (pentulose or hexulose) kinase